MTPSGSSLGHDMLETVLGLEVPTLENPSVGWLTFSIRL